MHLILVLYSKVSSTVCFNLCFLDVTEGPGEEEEEVEDKEEGVIRPEDSPITVSSLSESPLSLTDQPYCTPELFDNSEENNQTEDLATDQGIEIVDLASDQEIEEDLVSDQVLQSEEPTTEEEIMKTADSFIVDEDKTEDYDDSSDLVTAPEEPTTPQIVISDHVTSSDPLEKPDDIRMDDIEPTVERVERGVESPIQMVEEKENIPQRTRTLSDNG